MYGSRVQSLNVTKNILEEQKLVRPMCCSFRAIRDGSLGEPNRVNSALAAAGFFITRDPLPPRLALLRPHPSSCNDLGVVRADLVQGASRVATGLIQLNRCKPPWRAIQKWVESTWRLCSLSFSSSLFLFLSLSFSISLSLHLCFASFISFDAKR